MTDRITITEDRAGCWLDNHRGHYILRDMIETAVDFGFLVGPFERFALDLYDNYYGTQTYPFDALTELAGDARDWLNCGDNEGKDRAIKGQNSPPIIPEGYQWDWFDGDFGLYPYVLFNIGSEDNNGHHHIADDLTMPQARKVLTDGCVTAEAIERLLAQTDTALQADGFIVEAVPSQF